MKILLIAPQPFYTERGTPIAVRAVAETLAGVGHRVDVLTYHEGNDIIVDGVRLLRTRRPPLVRRVPIGPSWQKAACDAGLMTTAAMLMRRGRYDIIHGVEEGAFAAAFLGRHNRIPYIYDMDSLMSEQLREKGIPFAAAAPVFTALERWTLQRAAGVLAVCPCLLDHSLRHARRGIPVELLPDFPLDGVVDAVPDRDIAEIPGLKLVYVGNLESYQGVDLMLDAFRHVAFTVGDVTLVVVGGRPPEVAKLTEQNRGLVAMGRVKLLGSRPPSQLGSILAAADVLISPASKVAIPP